MSRWRGSLAAVRLFAQAGLDFESLKRRARDPGFAPGTLGGARFSIDMPTTTTRIDSRTVLATLPGTMHPDETRVFAAWTAEQRGLRGSETFVEQPSFAAQKTVANLTLYILQTAGLSRDVVLAGAGGREAGDAWVADHAAHCYHATCDAWSAAWDLAGAVQDVELCYRIGLELGNSRRWPQWRAGSEFKAIRDASAGVLGAAH